MPVIQYSPYPPAFYTFIKDSESIGLGSGQSTTDIGFWNLVWLSCTQCDDYEAFAENPTPGTILPIWTPPFLKMFTDTASHKLSGTSIGTLAALLPAEIFAECVLSHPDFTSIPIVPKHGISWAGVIRERAKRAGGIPGGVLSTPQAPVYAAADSTRARISSMGDWVARLDKRVKH